MKYGELVSDSGVCFVCGKRNPKGLKLDFDYDRNSGLVSTSVVFEEYMQGYSGIIHGGFISMLLDEVMAKSCLYNGYVSVTAKLNVRFIKPVGVGERIYFFGKIESLKGKVIKAVAWCEDEKSKKRAEAESTFIIVGSSQN